MTTARTVDHTPQAWLGCLSCYNAGNLVGDWYPASEAGDVTPTQLHGRELPEDVHEELWCFDHEGIPVSGELDPLTAARWGQLYDELDDPSQWPALCAWVRSGDHVEDGDGIPSLSDFTERFCGTWDSFLAYAIDLAEETGAFCSVPEDLRRFIDIRAWAAEIEVDYTTESAPGGAVYIFRSF
ncbi:antirestriction protein ArdA [Gordonia amicalis]|uniref:antirestriction protein ArdA n=1 Tax=Gordonia amicalis TaxID=89053 RepID=UPI0022B54B4B|nr:antirestriction protein ArdA [Gordonia amicalis]MCZ4579419.1 antirestriction protein ArdA [Gordonia amicalis]